MARIGLTEIELQTIAARIAPVAGWDRMTDISGDDIGYFEADDITPTDTSVAEWIATRGEPRREGDVLVFETVRAVRSGTKPGRSFEARTTVYVVEIAGGTAAYVEL